MQGQRALPLKWIAGQVAARALMLLLSGALVSTAAAQTLSEKLMQEGVAKLAVEARQKGDAVRGAILFAQQKLNCVKCHQSGAGDLLGPDLTRLGRETTDPHIVESLLMPSKVIKQGYEAVKILTEDGVVIIGRIIRQDDRSIVLRDNSDASRMMTLAKQALDRVDPSDVSAMPADLANQLEDRQQFLDLCKYLMDLAAASPTATALVEANGSEQLADRLKGLALMDEFRCAQCHRGDTGGMLTPASAPDLIRVGSRIDPDYLVRFLSDPQRTKAGTSMPHLLGGLLESARSETVQALVAYLRSRDEASFRRETVDRAAVDQAAIDRGDETFHRIGCVACHSPRNQDELIPGSVPLANLGSKYSIDSLTAFLEDPHAVRPSGRMPNMKLTHWEAVDLASFLVGVIDRSETPDDRLASNHPTAELIEQGSRAYVSLGCAQCHERNASADNSFLALNKLKPDRGCLSRDPDRKVRYEFSEAERAQITAAIESLDRPLDSEQALQVAMLTLRCYQCHDRDGIGGVSVERDLYFHSDDPNLGPQGRIPPRLTRVGAKLQAKWMRQVLVSGRSIRPYLHVRMPLYGTQNVEPLIDAFQRMDQLPAMDWVNMSDPEEAKKVGTDLVGSDGLNCVACHTFQQKPGQTMNAVDLTEMGERLKRDWFEYYMRDPQSLSPGTVMPSFWPGGKSIRPEIQQGNTDQQIATIWLYLEDGRQARQPRGVVIEPMELLAGEEAVMLRRSYQGIGKRGIGVGYPAQVNLAFDAEQLRLAMLWQGPFADPGGVWRGQGSGNVRPLSREVIVFPAGPDLDDAAEPWIVDEGRPPRHQFKGYRLDDLRRPAFRYRYDEIAVEDYLTDVVDDTEQTVALKRQVRFETDQPRGGLTFRVAAAKQIEQLEDSGFRLDQGLKIHVDNRYRATIVQTETEQRLVIPLQLSEGVTSMEIHYIW